MQGPSPSTKNPIQGIERVGFLKNFITRPNIGGEKKAPRYCRTSTNNPT